MSSLVRSLLTAVLFSFLAGCNVGPGAEAVSAEELASLDQSLATCSARCGTRTTLTCTGNVCSAVDGATGSVTCDGVTTACQTCSFNGVTYGDGQTVSSGVRCSAKVNGYCMGGVFAGDSCVASGECYATCVNGTWQ